MDEVFNEQVNSRVVSEIENLDDFRKSNDLSVHFWPTCPLLR